jgi:ferredoxin
VQKRAEQYLSARLSLDATACLTIRRPDAACDACIAICPTQSIVVDTRAVVLDHDSCTGCARCVAGCPTGALNHPATRLNPQPPSLILECSRVATTDWAPDAQVVPCLGGVSAGEVLEALATVETVILVDRGWCAGCDCGGCPRPWADAVQAASDDLARLDRNPGRLSTVFSPLPRERAQPAPQPRRPREQDYSRRQLFRRLTAPPPAPDRSRVTGARPFAGKVDVPALQSRRGHLRALNGGEPLPAALFPALEVTGAPDLRLAASLCPTEALQLLEAANADRLVFDAALCLACGQCEGPGGLTLRPRGHGTYAGRATLFSQAMADCARCLRRFAPDMGQRICDACHKDNDIAADAFGLMRRDQVPYGA